MFMNFLCSKVTYLIVWCIHSHILKPRYTVAKEAHYVCCKHICRIHFDSHGWKQEDTIALLNFCVEWLGVGIDVPDVGMIYQHKYHKQQQEFWGFQSSAMEDNGHLRCNVKHRGSCFLACHRNILPWEWGTKKDAFYYKGRSESKERFAVQRYLLIIGKKQNMQVIYIISHTYTYFST
jgi:hypothetical protein